MYLIEQEIANEIARERRIKQPEVRAIFEAETEEEAEVLEQKIRDNMTRKTGNSQIGRAMAVYSPLLWAHESITSYIQRTGDQSLRRVAPEVLTAEETALLAQRDLMLSGEEVQIVIQEIYLQGAYVSESHYVNRGDYFRIPSYSDLKRSTQKIRDKKHQREFHELLMALLKDNDKPGPEKNNEEETAVKPELSSKNQKEISLLYIEKIRRAALDKGITHQAIADITGFKQANVSRLLSGKYIPRLDNFLKLCEAIGIQVTLDDQKDKK